MQDMIMQAKRENVFKSDFPFFIQKHIIKSYPIHWHDFYEIEFICGINMTNVVLGVNYAIEDKACFMYLPHTFHYYKSDNYTNNECIIYNIAFSELFIDKTCINNFIKTFKDNPIMAQKPVIPYLEFYIKRIYDLYSDNPQLYRLQIKALLETVIYELCGQSIIINQRRDKVCLNIDEQQLLCYINCNFMQKLSIEHLSEFLHISPKYFSTFFKNTFNITYRDYIKQLKMNRAMDLLLYSDKKYSLNQISAAIGYESESNFLKAFISFFGDHPSKFLKM